MEFISYLLHKKISKNIDVITIGSKRTLKSQNIFDTKVINIPNTIDLNKINTKLKPKINKYIKESSYKHLLVSY